MDDELDWGALDPIVAPAPPVEPAPIEPPAEILPPISTEPLAPGLNPLALNEKEAAFARAYVESGNMAKAAREAGFEGGSSFGRKLLDRHHVAAEVARLSIEQGKALIPGEEPVTIAVDQVLLALYEISTASVLDAYSQDDDGKITPKKLADMPGNLRAAIKSIKFGKDGSVTIELYSKMDALRMLKDFFTERAERSRRTALRIPGEEPAETVTETETVQISRTRTFGQLVKEHGGRIAQQLNGRA
jgi:hypothetical protein